MEKIRKNLRILVALSGGVDSTITALRLKNEGHEIIGCYMILHQKPLYHEENIKKVKLVANYLDISYEILDLSSDFNEQVYKPFINIYKSGKTPNPCVICNREIKFGKLIEFAKSLNCDKIATGHYARIKDNFIYEAVDKSKDQSYFLSNIKKQNLNFIIFALGDSYKEDVKKQASEIEILQNFATQKESSEICFVENTYIDILKDYANVNQKGEVLNTKGEIIGSHEGYMHYTVGKRKGFRVDGAHDRHFVISTNPIKNQIVVGSKEELRIKEFVVHDINMFLDEKKFTAEVKIRYRSPKVACEVEIFENRAKVVLKDFVYALASGQMAVFYHDEKLIGGGWIE